MADDLTERVARALMQMHFDGTGCGDSQSPGACSNCYGPSPMSARETARAALAVVADDVDGLAGVLRAHADYRQRWDDPDLDSWYVCDGCGEEIETSPAHIEDEFRAHQAAMLAAYLRGA